MDNRLNYTLVGLFVLLLGGALSAAVFWLAIGGDQRQYDRYVTHTSESVSGLNPKAVVRYRGVVVGRVAAVSLRSDDPEQVRIDLDIEQGTPVREDTQAVVSTQGLTGIASIELTGGSRTSPPLVARAGEPPPEIPSGPSLVTRLDNAFTMIADNANDLSERLRVLLDDDNQRHLAGILANLDSVTGTFASHSGTIDAMMADLAATSSHLATATARLRQLVDDADTTLVHVADASAELAPILRRVNEAIGAVQTMTGAIARTSDRVGDVVATGQSEIRNITADTLPQLASLVTELGDLAGTLRRFFDDLDRNPRMLLIGRPSGEPGPGERTQ